MKRSKFSEHQIIAILKAVEAGRTVKEVCREHEVSDATYYKWKTKYGGMEAADIRRLRELEDENRRLKQMSAELLLENRALKDVIAKAVTPAVKRELVGELRREHKPTERRACAAVSLGRSVYRYRRRPNRDEELIKQLLELAHRRPEEGFPKLFKRLRRQGRCWNHKRVHRVYCSLKLTKRRKGKRRTMPFVAVIPYPQMSVIDG
jgi:putative transposase